MCQLLHCKANVFGDFGSEFQANQYSVEVSSTRIISFLFSVWKILQTNRFYPYIRWKVGKFGGVSESAKAGQGTKTLAQDLSELPQRGSAATSKNNLTSRQEHRPFSVNRKNA